MGQPYSGLTLLSAALGNDRNVFNLSEACFLEKDFKCNTRCSCGKKMKDCSFWHDVMHDIDLNSCDQSFFSKFYKQRNIDSCGDDFYSGSYLRRFFKLLGYEPRMLFPEELIKIYAEKCAFLFKVIFKASGKKIIVDSSKDTFWLKVLLRVPQVDVKVVWLKRDLNVLYN